MAVNIGYTLAKEFDKKVLLIDVDPQMNATQYTLSAHNVLDILEHPQKSIISILHDDYDLPNVVSSTSKEYTEDVSVILNISKNLDIIPSHLKLMGLDLDKSQSTHMLKQYINENRLRDKYDAILIDSPPTISGYMTMSLIASDAYLVPMKTDFLSYYGLSLLENHVIRFKKRLELKLDFLGIILTMTRKDWTIYSDVKDRILGNPEWKDKLFLNESSYSTKVEGALSPERREKGMAYIIEINNEKLQGEMKNITREFIHKARL